MVVTVFAAMGLLAAVFSTVSAKCYSGGQDGHKGTGLDSVNGLNNACMALMGSYTGGETRSTCIQDSVGTKWNFQLKVGEIIIQGFVDYSLTPLCHSI